LVFLKLRLLIIAPERHFWLILLGFGASVAPTVAAASIGIRAYAEIEVLARQSEHMVMAMQRLAKRVDALRRATPSQNLVSQDLGAIALEVATTMLQDVDGWARLFRVKVVEAS
jgi:N-acetylglutamate synthase/N-acetylornithine aminotransferase